MIRTVLPICLILASVPSAVAVPILNDAAHPTNDVVPETEFPSGSGVAEEAMKPTAAAKPLVSNKDDECNAELRNTCACTCAEFAEKPLTAPESCSHCKACLPKNGRRLLGTAAEEKVSCSTDKQKKGTDRPMNEEEKLRELFRGKSDQERRELARAFVAEKNRPKLVQKYKDYFNEIAKANLPEQEHEFFGTLIEGYPAGEQELAKALAYIPVDSLKKGDSVVKAYFEAMGKTAKELFWEYLTGKPGDPGIDSGCYIPYAYLQMRDMEYRTCGDLAKNLLFIAPPLSEQECCRQAAEKLEPLVTSQSYENSIQEDMNAAQHTLETNDEKLKWHAKLKLGFDITGALAPIPIAGDVLGSLSTGLNAVNDYIVSDLENENAAATEKIFEGRHATLKHGLDKIDARMSKMEATANIRQKSELEVKREAVTGLVIELHDMLEEVQPKLKAKWNFFVAHLATGEDCFYCEEYAHYQEEMQRDPSLSSGSCITAMETWWLRGPDQELHKKNAKEMCDMVTNLNTLKSAAETAKNVAETLKTSTDVMTQILGQLHEIVVSFDHVQRCESSQTAMNVMAGYKLVGPLEKTTALLRQLKPKLNRVLGIINQKVAIEFVTASNSSPNHELTAPADR